MTSHTHGLTNREAAGLTSEATMLKVTGRIWTRVFKDVTGWCLIGGWSWGELGWVYGDGTAPDLFGIAPRKPSEWFRLYLSMPRNGCILIMEVIHPWEGLVPSSTPPHFHSAGVLNPKGALLWNHAISKSTLPSPPTTSTYNYTHLPLLPNPVQHCVHCWHSINIFVSSRLFYL